jgi:hypothetical protein
MNRVWIVSLLGLVLGCSACSTQRLFDAGAHTALAVMTEELAQLPPAPPCPQAHYRLPVVTQVTVPDMIVGGVLIPQHPTYVVLQSGAWQVVDTAPLRQPGMPAVPPGCHPLPGGH